MKKLSLALALILVLTCAVFAACGDDAAETSSTAASSAAESKAESSVADQSPEAAESSEAEEESSEVEEESKEPVALGENIALNKSWTISTTDGGTTTEAADTANWNGNVTDGLFVEGFDAAEIWGTAAWLGLKSTANVGSDGYAYVTIDLGAVSDIAGVRVHLGNNSELGIPKPTEAHIMISEDGESFTPYGTLELQDVDVAGYWTELNGLASAQYVQLKVFVVGTWCFVNEIEVYAPAAE